MDQSSKSRPKQSSPGRIALMGAIATALGLFNMFAYSEAPSQAVALLQYVLLGAGLLALAGGLIMMAAAKS